MSENAKSFLRDGVKFGIIVALLLMCIFIFALSWFFPREPVVDKQVIQRLDQLTLTFKDLKEQNREILQTTRENNKRLSIALEKRSRERDEVYEDLMKKYGGVEPNHEPVKIPKSADR